MKPPFRVKDISDYLGGLYTGNADINISSMASIDKAVEGDITFLNNTKYIKYLNDTKASVIVISKEHSPKANIPCIVVENPQYSYAKLTELFANDVSNTHYGIHNSSFVCKSVAIHQSLSVGPFTHIDSNCQIGDNVFIGSNVSIGKKVKILSNTVIDSNVTIYPNVSIGSNVRIMSGTVVGSPGFGYTKIKNSRWEKIVDLGSVTIGNNVDIGSNTVIDRGVINDTIISDGVKLDNQIQVAHNVIIGRNTIIAGCSGLAGSCKIGENCVIGGAVKVSGHISIAPNVTITGNSAVFSSIDSSGIYSGYPAIEHKKWLRTIGKLNRGEKHNGK